MQISIRSGIACPALVGVKSSSYQELHVVCTGCVNRKVIPVNL